MFASKPNMKEIMTYEIIEFLNKKLTPKGVGVVCIGKHQCMGCRGVKKPTSEMITTELRGVFDTDTKARNEFFNWIT